MLFPFETSAIMKLDESAVDSAFSTMLYTADCKRGKCNVDD